MNYDDIRRRYGLGSSDDESDKKEENSTQSSTSPYDEIRKRYGITSPRIPSQGNTSDNKEEEKTPTFDYETGKKGWQKYLDDQSSAEQKKAKEKEDEKWWETLGRYLGSTGATDTTLSLGNTGQIINDVRNDTSYQRPSDDWSEEQQYQFGALYLESPGKAYSYAEKINNANNKAKEEAEINKIQDSATSNGWVGAAHTAGAIASAGLGMADYLNMLVLSNAGRDPLESDGVVSPFEYSTAVTEGIGTHLNETYGTLDEDIPIFGGKGWGDVYGLGTSIAQSFISGHTLGPAGILVSYFGQGAASGMKDALNRGASEWQAARYGAALGAFEGVAESIGIDNLFKLGSSSTIKGLLKNILQQAKAEGLEEGLTSVLSNIADAWIMKDKSNFNAMLNAYMEAGMSEKDAKWAVFWDSLEGIAFDMIAGAASGGIHGGLQTGIQTGKYSSYVKNAFGGQTQDIVNDALNSPHSSVQEIGQKYQEKLDSGKSLSGWNLYELLETTDSNKIKDATLKRLGELGETSDVTAVAEVLVKQAMGQELSSKDQNILNNSKYGNLVSTELMHENILSDGLFDKWSENIGTRMVSPEVYNKGKNIVAEDFPNKLVTKGVPEEEIATEAEIEASEEGDATLDDTISIMNNMVEKMELSDDVAGKMLEHFKPSDVQQAKLYQHAVPLAYNYGKIGYSAGLRYITSLSEQDKNYAYRRGAIDALIEADSKQSQIESSKTGSAQGTTKKKGIIYEGGYEYKEKTATPLQKSSMKAIEVINAISNLEIHVFESVEENGKRVYNLNGEKVNAPNGYFKDGNKIYIDINAGQHGEGLMLDTLGHEVTHYIRENDAKGFKAIADFLIEQYGKKGVNVEALLEGQRKKIRKRYARDGVALPSDAKLNDMAYEELVADAMSEMLSDPKAYDKLAKLKQENRSAWETLRDAIKNILDKIKSILDQYKSAKRAVSKDAATPEANAVRDFSADAYEKLQDLYIKAFVEADANYEAMGEKHLKNKDVLFNLRAVETHKSNLEKQYSNDASISLETLTERYNKIIGIWEKLGGELNSKFMNEWNNKVGKDRAFTVFKAQAGYKYNVELSSMCKKGVPLFEAIDTIVKEEVMKELDTKVIGKEEKEILYDLLKTNNFEIPCAICYVEQARQREGVIIDAFLNGKIEKNNAGKTTTFKLGWNEVLKAVEKEMKLNGVDYTFHAVDRSIATDKYVPADISMDEATQDAFYNALKKVANKEIARYNKAEDKNRKLVTSITPAAIKEVFKGTLPSNLKIFKVLFTEPSSRFTMESDLLYSSMTTHNLATAHNNLYSLFNSQGGVSGYKTKQGTVVYWGDILGKTWEPSKVRDEGGIRNQSNSDFQMYTLLDQVQMYVDFSAKGYYLQAYTKVLSELKLFGLSRGKINASLIPAVHVYHNADGSIDIETTRAYAGLDKNGNLLFDDIEGINHTEAFMLLEDAEYSKSIGGICIGYSDEHIRKLLDDKRVQQIIGFHDKTDDPDKRYKGAKYAKNYNGLNEAINNKDGKTVHLGFNPYVRKAEKMFTFDAKTETYKGEIEYNGKTYVADDIPKLAADLYLEMCKKKDYTPAYTDFDYHENYYKLLADFSLYDSQGHYAPHRKVAFNMPDSVPYLDINGKKKYMPTKDYIKAELEKELKVRDSISEALADKSETGLIPQFVKRVNESKANQSETKLSDRDSDYLDAVNRGDMVTAQRMVDEAAKEAGYYSPKLYHGTKMFGFTEVKTSGVEKGVAWSPFFAANKEDISATYVPYGKVRDISSTMDEDAIEEARETAIEERRETISDLVDDFRSLIDRYFSEWLFGQSDNSYLESLVENANPEAGHGDGVYDVLSDIVYDAFYDYQDKFVEYEDADDWYENSPEAQKIFSKIIEIEGEKSALYRLESDEELGGIYQLYANLDNMYVVDGKGAAWNELHPEGLPKIERGAFKDVPYKTRDVAEWARDNGFDGVIFKNIKDNGAYGRTPAGDVYAFFRPESQVKSADPVTYDDNGNVIPLSERFKADNNDIRYSDRDTETISNRTLLANALDSVAKNDIEKNRLNQYKSKIALIEAEQARLAKIRAELRELYFTKGRRDTDKIKSLQTTATQIENRINAYDRQLLKLESTEALKGVLDREKKMAYKKAEQRGKESLRRQKEKDAATVRELMARNYESRKKATESRNKTAMRAKIKKVVSELNQLLLHGSKERNVKLGLQEAVAAALDAINMDTVGADERIAKYNALIAKATDEDVIASLVETRDRIKAQGDSLGDKLKAMKEAYYAIQHGEESKNYPAYFKDEAALIEQRIQNVIDKVGNTSLRDMSLTQLDLVYDMYKLVLTTIRNANKVWKEGKALDLQDNASAVMTELEEIKELGEEGTKIGEHIRSYSWNEMTPYYAFDRIGSKTLKSFFMETIRGQNVYARDVAEAKAFADKIRKKYDYTKWDLDKVYEFKLKDNRTFQVTLKHMLSIYAYSKRDQALPHMSTGGFFFNDKSTFRKKGGIIELIRRTDSGYKIDAEILAEINEALGDKVNYVDEMQDYLTKMGEKGNEVTRTLWGIDLFKEKVYFPLKSMSDFIKKSTETAQSVSLKNDGMTKETVPGANNPIVLEAFDDVWASHIDRMSQYHAFVIPIDNLNKIHQYGTWAETESMAVSTMLTGRFGSAVNEYITQFIKDLNGNVVNPGAKNPLMGFLSKFKKTAVGASLSTVVQQPTAVLRAMADINAKYFIGKPNTKKLSNQWEELKQYAPIAIIKDIGGFDAGSGVQVSNWLNSDTLRGVDKVMNTIDDFSMKGAEVFDQLGWTSIWEAVKREISATTNLKVGSEEFLKKAGERFTEVIVRTQVYDSTLSRSGFMRSKSDTMKMLTAFMGEPTLSMNMMFNAIINAKRGGSKKQAVRTIGFTYASIIAASALSSLIYALRDDDDDESYLEKYMQSLGGEFISDVVLAPVTSLPAVKDIVSIFQGWDVERTDVAIFKDIKDAFDGLSSETKSPYRKVEDFAGAIASAFGLPLKNVLRTGREIYNAFSAITDDISGGDVGGAFVEGITGKGQSKPSQLYNAIINGDDARLERIKSSYKDESSYLNAVKTALRENDSRIHEAARARLDGNISEYTRIAREIIAEGHFSQDTVVAAINSEMSAIKKGESTQTESTDSKDEVTSIYRADDINVAFDNGDTSLALSIIDELVEMKMANGMDEKKAKSSLRSSMTSYWKPLYKQAYASGNTAEMQRIKQILYKSGLYGSATEVIKDVNSWLKN